MLDHLGIEVKVGDYVTYSLDKVNGFYGLQTAKVLEIKEDLEILRVLKITVNREMKIVRETVSLTPGKFVITNNVNDMVKNWLTEDYEISKMEFKGLMVWLHTGKYTI